jgi:uncharacterized paraquat-inducible protein A
MALIKCSECKNEISSLANTCPKCGYQINSPDNKSFNTIHIGVSTFLCILGIGFAASGIWAGWALFGIGLIWFIGARIASHTN